MPPIKAFKHAINIISFEDELVKINDIMNNGAIFCHVERTNADFQEIDVITDAYHMWHGAIPIFRTIDIRRIEVMKFIGMVETNHIDILDISISLDPRACIKKYFTVASVSWYEFEYIISGINLRRFNSKAIHRNNQLVLDKTISVLVIREADDKK